MRTTFINVMLITVIVLALLSAGPAICEDTTTGRDVLRKIDDMWRGDSSAALMTMQIKTEHWERTLEMKAYSLGKDLSLVRIILPKAEAGTATLKVEKNIWNYLPKTRRVMKIPASMMMGAWMGSHFTNDDLVRESRLEDDYDFTLETTQSESGAIYHIVLTAKKDAAVVWGGIELEVFKDNYVPIQERWYDEDGALVRTAVFEDITEIGDRHIPMTMRIVPEDKPNESTTIIYSKLKFNIDIDEKFFSLQNLQRTSW